MIYNVTSEFLKTIKVPDENAKRLNYLFLIPPCCSVDSNTQYRFPVGNALVCSALKASGREVFTLNLTYKSDVVQALSDALIQNDIDVLAVGALSRQYIEINYILNKAKEIRPSIKTIVGGGLITSDPEPAMSALENADIGVIGAGEITINDVAYAIENDESFNNIESIIFRDKERSGRLVITQKRKEIENLDILPFADYDGFDVEELITKSKPAFYSIPYGVRSLSICAGRSCQFNCTFCFRPSGSKYRQRSLDNIFKEVDLLVKKYKLDHITFVDESLINNREWFLEFCNRIESYGIIWDMSARIDMATEELLKAAKKSGCINALFGLEHTDNRILKSMRKHMTIEQYEHTQEIATRLGLYPSGNIIIGDYEETVETFKNSVKWWRNHPQYDIAFVPIMVFPGSPIYETACRRGIITNRIEYLKRISSEELYLNISKMTDDEYWRCFDEMLMLGRENRVEIKGNILQKAVLTRNENNTVNLTGICPYCGIKINIIGI